MFFYRQARWLYLHHIPFLPKILELIIFLLYNSKVPYESEIGKGTFLGYGGMGVVIHKKAKIGKYCVISQQVTVGGGNNRFPGQPTIGNNVYMAKGSIIFGGITIGNNVTIGANAVVGTSVPDNAVVAGVPARVLRIKTEEQLLAEKYYKKAQDK